MFDQKRSKKDRDESELVTEKKLRYRFDDMRSGDVVLSELHSGGGEPDLDHVLCGGQRGNEAVHVPKSLRTGPDLRLHVCVSK